MRSLQSLLLGKKKLTSLGQDQLRRLVLLGENKERSLQRQIDTHEKTKENLFRSVTHAPSSDRQKRFTAQKIASLEYTIQSLDRALRTVAMETRFVQRMMELKDTRSKHSNSLLLDSFAVSNLSSQIQQISVDEQLRDERHNEIQAALDGASSTYAQGESARVMEIFRQIVEVSEASLGAETNFAQPRSTVMDQRSNIS